MIKLLYSLIRIIFGVKFDVRSTITHAEYG